MTRIPRAMLGLVLGTELLAAAIGVRYVAESGHQAGQPAVSARHDAGTGNVDIGLDMEDLWQNAQSVALEASPSTSASSASGIGTRGTLSGESSSTSGYKPPPLSPTSIPQPPLTPGKGHFTNLASDNRVGPAVALADEPTTNAFHRSAQPSPSVSPSGHFVEVELWTSANDAESRSMPTQSEALAGEPSPSALPVAGSGKPDSSSLSLMAASSEPSRPVAAPSLSAPEDIPDVEQAAPAHSPCGIEPPDHIRAAAEHVTDHYPARWVAEAWCVGYYESARLCGWDAAYNCKSVTNDHCLFQVNRPTWERTVIARYGSWEAIYQPEVCWDMADYIHERRSRTWGAWNAAYLAGVQ